MQAVQKSDPVFIRIDQLLKRQGKQQKELIEFLSMAKNTYGNWKLQKNRSYLKHIDEIANFFGVSPNYLIRGEECLNITSHEEELVRFFRKLNPQNADTIFTLVKTIVEKNN